MNTTGIQNYLSNVFRPIVEYNATTSNFIPKLELSNIDTYSGNTVSVFRADVGDSNFNVYVGKESGNSLVDIRSCSNVSAFGYGAGSNISNDQNSVYVGYRAGAGNIATRSIIAIGSEAGGGGIGLSNIFIGTNTKSTTGSRNILIGHDLSTNLSDQIRIGKRDGISIAADMSLNWVGLGGILTPTNTMVKLDVSGVTASTGGYYSIQSIINTVGLPSYPVAPTKKGIIYASAVQRNNPAANYAAVVFFSPTGTFVSTLSSTSSGSVSFGADSNIIIATGGTTGETIDYNITYFPLP